jgi:hypothetical protein
MDKNLVIPGSEPCAVRDTLLIIGGKWKSIIMHTVHNQESMQNWGRQLSNLFDCFIIRRPKAGMPVSKRLFQEGVQEA